MAKADKRIGKYDHYFGHPDDIKDGVCVIPDGAACRCLLFELQTITNRHTLRPHQ